MSIENTDERDQRALQALAIIAEAIADPESRKRIKADRRGGISDALGQHGRDIGDLPEELLAFFANLADEEIDTLAKLQTTMAGLSEKGFPSLSENVPGKPFHTLAKL
jgi:hypothetical protein